MTGSNIITGEVPHDSDPLLPLAPPAASAAVAGVVAGAGTPRTAPGFGGAIPDAAGPRQRAGSRRRSGRPAWKLVADGIPPHRVALRSHRAGASSDRGTRYHQADSRARSVTGG